MVYDEVMRTVAASEFKATCLALLERVQKTGKPIIVTKRGRPLAKIAPLSSSEKKKRDILGYMKGTGRILGDIESPASEARDWEVLRS